jgi:hypothetical protein
MVQISNSIGGGNYGQIVQAGRDANVIRSAGPATALDAAGQLRAAIGELDLAPDARAGALGALDEIDAQLRRPEPDQRQVADRLERLTTLLRHGGSLLGAGAALIHPIGAIAAWLGPLGASLLASLR